MSAKDLFLLQIDLVDTKVAIAMSDVTRTFLERMNDSFEKVHKDISEVRKEVSENVTALKGDMAVVKHTLGVIEKKRDRRRDFIYAVALVITTAFVSHIPSVVHFFQYIFSF